MKEEFEEEYGDNNSDEEDEVSDAKVRQVGQVAGTEYFTEANAGSFL